MKLRLEKGIIKVRLSSTEIDLLHNERKLVENIYISSNNKFTYTVVIDENAEMCDAHFNQNLLQLVIPIGKADKWMNSNQVGIKETIITDNDDKINLTLEEDLPPRKHKKTSK